MKNGTTNIVKYALVLLSVPFIAGCGGGGAAFLGSLFGASGTLLASAAGGAAGAAAAAGGGGLAGGATLVQPEPATMFMMGSGMAAVAYFKSFFK